MPENPRESAQPKHTPEPWEVVGFTLVVNHSLATQVASVNGRDAQERADNARLIAAAPDLLAFAQKAVRELNEIRARDGVPYTHSGWKASVDEDYFSSVVDDGFAAIAKAEASR